MHIWLICKRPLLSKTPVQRTPGAAAAHRLGAGPRQVHHGQRAGGLRGPGHQGRRHWRVAHALAALHLLHDPHGDRHQQRRGRAGGTK